jgi:hypothetical protein
MLNRAARLRLLIVGMAVTFVWMTPPSASAQSGLNLSYLAADGVARGMTARYAIENYLPVNQPLDVSSVFAEARLELQRSTSLAAMPFPGDTVIGLTPTIAGLANIPNLPPYPFAARADNPSVPQADVAPNPGNGVGAATLHAEAQSNRAAAKASLASFTASNVLAEGTVDSSVESFRDADGIVVHALSVAKDVSLLGGVVHLGTVRTEVTVGGTPGHFQVRQTDLQVEGVTVGGQPAQLGPDGLTVGGQPATGLPDASKLLPNGFTLQTLPATSNTTETAVTASSGVVVLTESSTLQGSATKLELWLGSATASITARDATVAPSDQHSSTAVVSSGGAPSVPGKAAKPTASAAASPAASVNPVRTGARTNPLPLLDFRPVYLPLVLAGGTAIALRRRLLRTQAASSDLRVLWRW